MDYVIGSSFKRDPKGVGRPSGVNFWNIGHHRRLRILRLDIRKDDQEAEISRSEF